MSLGKTISDSVVAFQPMLSKMSLDSKIEMHNAIYSFGASATDEMLTLGVAITADPYYQRWMNERLAQNQREAMLNRLELDDDPAS